MIDVHTVKLPTHFREFEVQEEDSRFQKVKIYIAHTGENLNNSVFTKEVFEEMMPSLSNIPILGCVDSNPDGEEDFRGHEKTLRLNNGNLQVKFNTHAYGFIPEDNNAHFETTGGKEWLVAEGYLWTRFVDAIDLFNQSSGSKGQSMEIMNAEGYTDDLGRTVFTHADFAGLCILGDDVVPAMTGSTISTVFSQTDVKSAFEEMLAEFAAEKGVKALATKKKQDEDVVVKTDKPSASTDDKEKRPSEKPTNKPADKPSSKPDEKPASDAATADKGNNSSQENKGTAPADNKGEAAEEPAAADTDDDNAEMSAKEDDKDGISLPKNESASKEKDKKDFKQKATDGSDGEDQADSEEDDDSKKKDQFEISLNTRQWSFIEAVRNKYGSQYDWISLEDCYEDYGIVRATKEEFGNGQWFRIDYSLNADDSVKLGDKTEVFSMFITAPEKEKIEADRAKLTDLEAQIEQLKAYKAGIEMQAKEDLVKENKDELTAKQIEDIRGQFAAKSVEEIEKEIAFALYTTRKSEFTAQNRLGGAKAIELKRKDYGYGSANDLFRK